VFRNSLIQKIDVLKLSCEVTLDKEDDDATPEQRIIEEETENEKNLRLAESISQLSPRQREAVYLRFFMQMSYEETASVMGITIKALYKLMARSLEVLKKKYALILLIINLLFA